MEKECPRCHRVFPTANADAEMCPECLRQQFSRAAQLDADEQQALENENKAAGRRRAERVLRIQKDLGRDNSLGSNSSIGLRVTFAVLLYGGCLLTFILSADSHSHVGVGVLDEFGQRVVSLLFCVVAGVLMFSAVGRYPVIGYITGFVMLLSGWFLPDIRNLSEEKEENQAVVQRAPLTAKEVKPGEKAAPSDRALSESELDVFKQQKAAVPNLTHYAVYMTQQDTRTRSLVRDALSRLLGGEYTRAYTRGDGALYVVTNVHGKMRNISRVLSRFGRITYAAPADGVYELEFDPEKVNMVSSYPSEVLSDNADPSFVNANISELSSLDPMRLRAAAQNLGNANVQMLRREVRDSLLRVLQEPWAREPDTYTALAEAAVVYTETHDKQATEACHRYFTTMLAMDSEVSPSVVNYLISEMPDAMAEPVVNLWIQNPTAWSSFLVKLGDRVQPLLVQNLTNEAPLRTINNTIKYLKDYGNAEAIPAIKPFTDHSDSIVRHAAQEAIHILEKR